MLTHTQSKLLDSVSQTSNAQYVDADHLIITVLLLLLAHALCVYVYFNMNNRNNYMVCNFRRMREFTSFRLDLQLCVVIMMNRFPCTLCYCLCLNIVGNVWDNVSKLRNSTNI